MVESHNGRPESALPPPPPGPPPAPDLTPPPPVSQTNSFAPNTRGVEGSRVAVVPPAPQPAPAPPAAPASAGPARVSVAPAADVYKPTETTSRLSVAAPPKPDGLGAPPPPAEAALEEELAQDGTQEEEGATSEQTPFRQAMSNLWSVQEEIWDGRLSVALGRAKTALASGAGKWVIWALPFLLVALLQGVLGIFYVSKMTSGGEPVAFGTKVLVFFVVFAFSWALLFLRVFSVKFASGVSGVRVSFSEAAMGVGVVQNLWWLPLLLLNIVLSLVSAQALTSGSSISLAIIGAVGVAGGILYLLAENAMFVYTATLGKHNRSPLVPYALFSWFTQFIGAATVISIVNMIAGVGAAAPAGTPA